MIFGRGTINSQARAWSTSLLQYVDLTVDADGNLNTAGAGGGGGGGLTDTQLRATPVPVSGTVTANAGSGTLAVSAAALPLPSGASTSALQTQPGVDIGDVTINNATGGAAVNVQDGGNSLTVDGTVAVSGSVAVTGPLTDAQIRATPLPISGTVTVTDGSGALNVIVDSGTTTVTQGTGTNLHTVVDSGTLSTVSTVSTVTNVVHVDDNAGSLTVDGTVAVSGSVAVTGPLTDAQLRATPVPISGTVTITDGSGAVNVIVDSGVVTTITNVVHVDDNSGTLSIDDGAGSITVDGTFFQATQPVSAASLPLPTGAATLAEQQNQTTALQIIDDWDESDRAKVNTIVGQVGVQGGAGVSTALTQRVAIATDANTIGGAVVALADALEVEDNAGYVDGATGQRLTQTIDGRLRVAVAGVVSAERESYEPASVRSLSITTDGRLRVSSSSSASFIELFREADDLFFGVPVMAKGGQWVDVDNNPWGF